MYITYTHETIVQLCQTAALSTRRGRPTAQPLKIEAMSLSHPSLGPLPLDQAINKVILTKGFREKTVKADRHCPVPVLRERHRSERNDGEPPPWRRRSTRLPCPLHFPARWFSGAGCECVYVCAELHAHRAQSCRERAKAPWGDGCKKAAIACCGHLKAAIA